jgi:hypothetical protein
VSYDMDPPRFRNFIDEGLQGRPGAHPLTSKHLPFNLHSGMKSTASKQRMMVATYVPSHIMVLPQ